MGFTAPGYQPVGQVNRCFAGKIALSASATTTATLGTVPAGKLWFLTDIYISHDSSAQIDVQIQAAGQTIFRCVPKGDTAPIELAGLETQPACFANQLVTVFWPITATPPNAYFYLGFVEVTG